MFEPKPVGGQRTSRSIPAGARIGYCAFGIGGGCGPFRSAARTVPQQASQEPVLEGGTGKGPEAGPLHLPSRGLRSQEDA